MKIITWNLNGIRSLKKSISCILDDFASDVICFQETKISRSQLPENIALIDGYSSYFNYPKNQSGYSGVATYCKDAFMPDRAEDTLSVDPRFKTEFSSNIFAEFDIDDTSKMDFEGRVIVTEHLIKHEDKIQKLAVINVYCPRVDPEKPERHIYKMMFCHLLQLKMYQLCEQECFVVIVGDLNIACAMIDHCDPCDKKEFESSESRIWLNSFLSKEVQVGCENIKAIDAFRFFYPDKKEAYTCWNTKIGARLTNYGTRIDYVLVSSNMVPLLSNCEILKDYQGSDHCPVLAELKCECIPKLSVQLPAICTRLWPEFAGHQQKLNSFFQKAQNTVGVVTDHKEPNSQLSVKRKNLQRKNNQKSITSFFSNNTSTSQNSNIDSTSLNQETQVDISVSNSEKNKRFCNMDSSREPTASKSDELEEHFQNGEKKNTSSLPNKSNEWKSLLRGPPKPPLCNKHKKPCVLRTVKKNGPNLGRQFFMCAQPVGASSNPDANCNFFKWASTPKVNTLKS